MTDAAANPPDAAPSPDEIDFFAAFSKSIVLDALDEGLANDDWAAVKAEAADPSIAAAELDEIREGMLTAPRGLAALWADPDLARAVVCGADPEKAKAYVLGASAADLATIGFWASPTATDGLKADVLMALAQRPAGDPADPGMDRATQRDPAVFAAVARNTSADTWNDTNMALGTPKRELGPRVCAALWAQGDADNLVTLIEHGVDTTRAAVEEGRGPGTYSGFVMPLQHIIQKQLHEIPNLPDPPSDPMPREEREARTAQAVFGALERTATAVTLTSYDDVVNSPLLQRFRDTPGTIWGFENIREPYVHAAHATDEGLRPVRMMELWPAVSRVINRPADYEALLADPDTMIPQVVESVTATMSARGIENAYRTGTPEQRERFNTYVESFRKEATALLRELVAQMPEGALSRPSADMEARDDVEGPISLTDVMGVNVGKYMGGVACRAGLYYAKSQGEPVYYCLDGLDMEDVINYSAVKNAAIDAFLAEGGAADSENTFREVITLVEVREILQNWADLSDTVIFVQKGVPLEGAALAAAIDDWTDRLQRAEQAAGRTPAPPRAQFERELRALDSTLVDRLNAMAGDGDAAAREADMDARDIVRQGNYLVKVAKARPAIVIKYLVAKCEILMQYGLVPVGLPAAARDLAQMAAREGDDAPSNTDVNAMAKRVARQVNGCIATFRAPLAAALIRLPLFERQKRWHRLNKGIKKLRHLSE